MDNKSLSKLKEMREQVKEELKYLPRERGSQNTLRQLYWMKRMESLKEGNKSKEDVLKECIDVVREEDSSFVPQFIKEYFNMEEKK